MIRVFYFAVMIALIGCNSSNPNKSEQTTKEEKAEVIFAKVKAYDLTDKLKVNSITAKIYNNGPEANYQYAVTLYQGENSWSDTIRFRVLSGDTVHQQFVFSESRYDVLNPASFSGKLEAILEKEAI